MNYKTNKYINKAMDDYKEYSDEILYKNRFFPNNNLIKVIETIMLQNKRCIKKGKELYRARVYDDNDTKNIKCMINALVHVTNKEVKHNEFYGYDENNSLSPPYEKAGQGRANSQFISVLYVAEDKATALAEVRPSLKAEVSIAKIKLIKDISIIDLTNCKNINGIDSDEDAWCFLLDGIFSSPISKEESDKKYIITQYIVEYIKLQGFDGMRYNSSLSQDGVNMVLFSDLKVKVESSRVYKVNSIGYIATCREFKKETVVSKWIQKLVTEVNLDILKILKK